MVNSQQAHQAPPMNVCWMMRTFGVFVLLSESTGPPLTCPSHLARSGMVRLVRGRSVYDLRVDIARCFIMLLLRPLPPIGECVP